MFVDMFINYINNYSFYYLKKTDLSTKVDNRLIRLDLSIRTLQNLGWKQIIFAVFMGNSKFFQLF
jgi:hypothetical protein